MGGQKQIGHVYADKGSIEGGVVCLFDGEGSGVGSNSRAGCLPFDFSERTGISGSTFCRFSSCSEWISTDSLRLLFKLRSGNREPSLLLVADLLSRPDPDLGGGGLAVTGAGRGT